MYDEGIVHIIDFFFNSDLIEILSSQDLSHYYILNVNTFFVRRLFNLLRMVVGSCNNL